MDSVIGQLKGQFTRHTCVRGQNMPCACTAFEYFAELTVVLFVPSSFFLIVLSIVNRTWCCPILSVIILVINNWTPTLWSSDFVNHLMYMYDYRPNWTPLCLNTIIYNYI